MRDTVYNAATFLAIAIFVAFISYTAVTLISNMHAAEACMEDEVWAPVEYGTPDSSEDSHGVNRVCVNIEEM